MPRGQGPTGRAMSEHVSARDAIARLSDEHLAADAAFAAELDDAGRQRLLVLAEGLRNLPEPGRFALLLRELEGREYEEIARIADLTPVEARQQVFQARLKLQGDVEAPTEHCDEVRAAMSKSESSFHDRRSIEAHLESCQVCSW